MGIIIKALFSQFVRGSLSGKIWIKIKVDLKDSMNLNLVLIKVVGNLQIMERERIWISWNLRKEI